MEQNSKKPQLLAVLQLAIASSQLLLNLIIFFQ